MSIDKKAGNDNWDKALNKDTSKVNIAWQWVDWVTPDQARSGSVKELSRHQDINCHIIFDIHMAFQQKVRFLVRGHTTEAPNSIKYSRTVSRDSICIGFLLESLYGVSTTVIDLNNSYLNSECAEKIWFVGDK